MISKRAFTLLLAIIPLLLPEFSCAKNKLHEPAAKSSHNSTHHNKHSAKKIVSDNESEEDDYDHDSEEDSDEDDSGNSTDSEDDNSNKIKIYKYYINSNI